MSRAGPSAPGRPASRTGPSSPSWRSEARDAPRGGLAITKLGKRIRTLRLERELTQEHAAELAKLDMKHWQDIEGARTNPTVATLVGVAKALGVKLGELFEDMRRKPAR